MLEIFVENDLNINKSLILDKIDKIKYYKNKDP